LVFLGLFFKLLEVILNKRNLHVLYMPIQMHLI